MGDKITILAGDSGGTKTLLAIYTWDGILKQHDKSMNVINGHAVSIPGREAARIKQDFTWALPILSL